MSRLVLEGRAHIYGDDVDTDKIAPAHQLGSTRAHRRAEYALYWTEGEGGLIQKCRDGINIIVAGKHFGTGSSRESAPRVLKEAGVKAVCAEFFARIFYRNAINIGLPVMECKGIPQKVHEKDKLRLDLETGKIENLTTGEIIQGNPVRGRSKDILESGGLVPYIKKKKKN